MTALSATPHTAPRAGSEAHQRPGSPKRGGQGRGELHRAPWLAGTPVMCPCALPHGAVDSTKRGELTNTHVKTGPVARRTGGMSKASATRAVGKYALHKSTRRDRQAPASCSLNAFHHAWDAATAKQAVARWTTMFCTTRRRQDHKLRVNECAGVRHRTSQRCVRSGCCHPSLRSTSPRVEVKLPPHTSTEHPHLVCAGTSALRVRQRTPARRPRPCVSKSRVESWHAVRRDVTHQARELPHLSPVCARS